MYESAVQRDDVITDDETPASVTISNPNLSRVCTGFKGLAELREEEEEKEMTLLIVFPHSQLFYPSLVGRALYVFYTELLRLFVTLTARIFFHVLTPRWPHGWMAMHRK